VCGIDFVVQNLVAMANNWYIMTLNPGMKFEVGKFMELGIWIIETKG